MNTMTLSIARFICVVSLVMVLSTSSQQSVCAQLSALPPQVWPQNPVTVSFAPDSVGIGIFRNEIHQHLKATMDEKQYRIEILKACQEWSRNSGINFALVGDSPRDFGTPGLSQSDPRFGDIRFGAFPQTNVLGNAIPYHPTAGTWAGDILLDTNTIYEIQSPETTQIVAERADLFSVALHELGNTIGLVDDNFDPESVMYYRYAGRRQSLSPFDVQNVQFLYGPRANDPYEDRQGNESIATASIINWSADFVINSSQTVRGRINASQDVDVYRIRGNTLSDKLWVTLNCRGLSLLCPKVTILDDEGRVIDTASSESPLDNSVTKELTSFYPDETRYLVVEWNGIPEFEFGDYELE
ncbi:MAG: matrixin family metalloprotease, partial [Candidatus Moraniibacteriota bacterium]